MLYPNPNGLFKLAETVQAGNAQDKDDHQVFHGSIDLFQIGGKYAHCLQ